MLAITVEACKSEWTGEPDGMTRVILWDVELQANGKYRGPVVDVAEHRLASEALQYMVTAHRLEGICQIMSEDSKELLHPEELSLVEACQAYFGSRIKGLTF